MPGRLRRAAKSTAFVVALVLGALAADVLWVWLIVRISRHIGRGILATTAYPLAALIYLPMYFVVLIMAIAGMTYLIAILVGRRTRWLVLGIVGCVLLIVGLSWFLITAD